MKDTRIVALLFQHDDDDFSLWLPEIPTDDPHLFALCDKYATNGSSARGSGSEISFEVIETLNALATDENADCNDQCVGCERACADRIHVCKSCGRAFSSECFEAQTGIDTSLAAEGDMALCSDCLLESSIQSCVNDWLSDYGSRMPKHFLHAIIRDVKESSGFYEGEGFGDDDIRLAFARVIAQQFGVRV